MLRNIAPFVLAAVSAAAANASTIDTTASSTVFYSSGHGSVGQTLTVDPAEDVLEDISFYFFAAPAGVDYHLTISDVSSGTILLSRDFHAIGGQNLFTLGLDLDGVSQISADIASSVYGMRAGFVSNVYSGGQASFSGYANSLYDLAFIANFSDGSGDGDGGPSLVPLPASLPLLATVLLGAGLAGRRGRKA